MRLHLLALTVCVAVFASCNDDTVRPFSPMEPSLQSQGSMPRILDLGTLGGPGSNAQAINESGQVVGWSPLATGELHAFLWTETNGMKDLGPGRALEINDRGVVLLRRPEGYVLWTERDSRSTGLTGSYTVSDLNNAGVLVGQTPEGFAFTWSEEGGLEILSDLGNGWSIASAVNDRGLVTGYAVTDRMRGGFVWEKTTGPVAINSYPGAAMIRPVAINDNGQIAGIAYFSNTSYRAFRWSHSEGWTDVGPAMPSSIDRFGNIIGTADSRTRGWSYAFYWSPQGGMTNLHWLAPRPLSSYGHDLNDSGLIVGQSARFDRRKTGVQGHATLWKLRTGS
ncbi:MAG TPA: hypothetical protein VFP10_11610 [Candidatus Eisenbacteria bacterium]|nr:hypothetical protein [Candidatus Eisenbacteria bacterium]